MTTADWPPLEKLPLHSLEATCAALLPSTLKFAAEAVPYYRRRWRHVRALKLSALPFLHKPEAIAHQRDLLTARDAYTGVISSGTHHTTGPVLQVPRTDDEARATEAYNEALGGDGAPDDGWTLEVRAAHHGVSDVQPGRLLVLWTYSTQPPRLVEQLLSRPQADGRRITTMVINAGALKPLTAWFLSRGIQPARFKLQLIGTTSFRLSPFWKALVEEVWGCPVFDNFSLSELPGPAIECEDCGFHHWLPPPMVTEVVDPVSKRPLKSGTGVLVVTTLAPFVTRMPLIRYWTGDVVTLGPRCKATGVRGFRARGREAQSLWHRKHGLLVAAQDVTDFLEGRPEVSRHPHPMETLGFIPPGDCGAVKFELSQARREVRVKVELRFDPLLYSVEAAAVATALTRHLMTASSGLKRYDSTDGELVIEVCRPGALQKPWMKL